MLEQRKIAIKDIVSATDDIAVQAYEEFKAGKIDEETAKQRALASLRAVRFGEDGKDYIFIHNNDQHCVLLPPKPTLEGKDLSQLKDKNGVSAQRSNVEEAKSGRSLSR